MLYKLTDITYQYEQKTVLSINSLGLPQGKVIGFMGPNGSGKSTLFNLLGLVTTQQSGTILYKNKPTDKLSPREKKEITILPQEPYLLQRTVFVNVAYGLKIRKERDNIKEKVTDALQLTGFSADFGARMFHQLSGGERQRVALAARLVLKPTVLILDEPTANVDVRSAWLIREAIFKAREQWGVSLLISSHDHNWLEQVADYQVNLFQGKLMEQGSINLIFGPWQKTAEQSKVVKRYSDGQELVLDSKPKKENHTVAAIAPHDIVLSGTERAESKNRPQLRGIISTIKREKNKTDSFIVEVIVAGFPFMVNISRQQVEKDHILPGSEVTLCFTTDKIDWL